MVVGGEAAMTPTRTTVLALGAALLLSACGGFRLRVPAPARPIAISGFEVVAGPQIPPDRQRVLQRLGAMPEMALALRSAYPAGQGPFVRVILTQYRSGRWGPTRMHAVVQVLGPAQNLLTEFHVDSTTTRGGRRGAKTRRVAQDIVNQIAARL